MVGITIGPRQTSLAFVRGIGSYSPIGQRISVARLLLSYAYSLKHREHWGQLDVEKLTAEVESLVRESSATVEAPPAQGIPRGRAVAPELFRLPWG